MIRERNMHVTTTREAGLTCGENEKRRNEKRMKEGVKKAVAAVSAVGLAAVVAAGVWAGVAFLQQGNGGNYDFGQQMQVTPSGGNGVISLASYTKQNDEGRTVQEITATVTPPDATNAIVDWSISWGDTQGSWGSGSQGDISDYLTITPESDGALTAEVECLAPFGTQAVITANIRGYEDIKDTCTVDYVQKYEDVTASIAFQNGTSSDNVSWTLGSSTSVTAGFLDAESESDLAAYTGSGSVTADYSDVYTIESGAASVTVSYAYTAEYVAALEKAGIMATANSYETLASSLSGNTATLTAIAADELLGFDGESVTDEEYDAYRTYLIENASDVMLMVKIDVTSNEEVAGGSKVYQLKFSDIGSLAGNIELSDSNIRF